jgi:hypothetical protein
MTGVCSFQRAGHRGVGPWLDGARFNHRGPYGRNCPRTPTDSSNAGESVWAGAFGRTQLSIEIDWTDTARHQKENIQN